MNFRAFRSFLLQFLFGYTHNNQCDTIIMSSQSMLNSFFQPTSQEKRQTTDKKISYYLDSSAIQIDSEDEDELLCSLISPSIVFLSLIFQIINKISSLTF